MKLPSLPASITDGSLHHFRLFYLRFNIDDLRQRFWREGDPQSRSEAVIEPA